MQNTPPSYCAALKHWPGPQLGQSRPTMPRSRTKWASLSKHSSSSKHFRRLQWAKIPFPSKHSRNHKYFFRGIRRGHKDKLSCILGYSYGKMCHLRKDIFPPLCLALSFSSTVYPHWSPFQKCLRSTDRKHPIKSYVYISTENSSQEKEGWFCHMDEDSLLPPRAPQ